MSSEPPKSVLFETSMEVLFNAFSHNPDMAIALSRFVLLAQDNKAGHTALSMVGNSESLSFIVGGQDPEVRISALEKIIEHTKEELPTEDGGPSVYMQNLFKNLHKTSGYCGQCSSNNCAGDCS